MEKICIKCDKLKNILDFGKRKDSTDGHRSDCKECRNLYLREYKAKNRDILSLQKKEYRKRNKEIISIKHKSYREKNKEKIKQQSKLYQERNKDAILLSRKKSREKNREKIAIQKKSYYEKNKESENRRKNEWTKEKMKSDPIFKLICNMRTLIKNSIKNAGYIKSHLEISKSEKILGCSINEFRSYIELKFLEGMSWINHGEWHLDHIIPCSFAKNEEEVIKLNHYTNFQPLWAFENQSKGNRFIG